MQTQETGWTVMQMAFSTADQERMVFYAPVGTPSAAPITHVLPVEHTPAGAGSTEPEPLRLVLVGEELVPLDAGSPPGSVPFSVDAPLMQLARE